MTTTFSGFQILLHQSDHFFAMLAEFSVIGAGLDEKPEKKNDHGLTQEWIFS